MAEEREIDLEPFKAVLAWIVEDEKRHEQILRMIKNLLIKRDSRKLMVSPSLTSALTNFR